MTIGIAGLGRMGNAIAHRLLTLGEDVVVWNRSVKPAPTTGDRTASVASTPAELASSVDVIITSLTGADAIEDVYRGTNGLLSAAVGGKLFIEMSTVRPEVQRALAEDVSSCGAAFVDCPVGGTTGPARDGKLFGFVGGSENDVARAKPVLDKLCRRLEHVGPVGAGALMKLAINLPLMVYWQALGEALALCEPLGLDEDRLMDIFADTSGGANVLKARGAIVAKALRGQDTGPVTLDVDLVRKDLALMLSQAVAAETDLPLSKRAAEVYDVAINEGLGSCDATILPTLQRRRSGKGSS